MGSREVRHPDGESLCRATLAIGACKRGGGAACERPARARPAGRARGRRRLSRPTRVGPQLPADPHHVDHPPHARADPPIDLELVAAAARLPEPEHHRLHPGAVDEVELGEVEPHRAAVLAVLTEALLDRVGDRDVELPDQGHPQRTIAIDGFSDLKRRPGECHACRRFRSQSGGTREPGNPNGKESATAASLHAQARSPPRARRRRRLAPAAAGLPGRRLGGALSLSGYVEHGLGLAGELIAERAHDLGIELRAGAPLEAVRARRAVRAPRCADDPRSCRETRCRRTRSATRAGCLAGEAGGYRSVPALVAVADERATDSIPSGPARAARRRGCAGG